MTNKDRQAAWRARQRQEGLTTHPTRAVLTAEQKRDKRKAYRQAHPDKRKKEHKDYKVAHFKYKLPFVGCDGEGAGKDELGRQLYLLFRMGDRELYTGNSLSTEEILDFICNAPKQRYYVGFSFGYDVTMILRDLTDANKNRLFQPRIWSKGFSPYVWFKNFEVDYLPKQYFRVRRIVIDDAGRPIPVKGSVRCIYEVFGFFQKSFLRVCEQFSIGTVEQRKLIAESKASRGSDEWIIDQTTRDYCALECDMLADTMERLRHNCFEAGIRPTSWNGAGKLAKALHKDHLTPKLDTLNIPKEASDLAAMAYYGGRFEVTRVGFIEQRVHEYDIRSAYPAAMQSLPCLLPEHGCWSKASAKDLSTHRTTCTRGFYIASVSFGGVSAATAPLPIRTKEGFLYWPQKGNGVYFSCEIESAIDAGTQVHFHSGWMFKQTCDCKPFAWVEELYEYRRAIGASDQGYPIKLGINSLYGALAQRIGSGKYSNFVWAGLITALTRALLNTVARQAPQAIVMFATDALYSTEQLNVPIGERLGQWEHSELEDMFIVQPGLYWDRARHKQKSRGLSGKFFEQRERTQAFESAWIDYLAALNSGLETQFPSVQVPVTNFIGLRLAASRGKHETAGVWKDETRSISFDPRRKRDVNCVEGSSLMTNTKKGSYISLSLPHRDFIKAGGAEAWDRARLEFDEQPDFVDVSEPWRE